MSALITGIPIYLIMSRKSLMLIMKRLRNFIMRIGK